VTFDPVAYDSTPEPSVALLAEHQLRLQEAYTWSFTTITFVLEPDSICIILSAVRNVPPYAL